MKDFNVEKMENGFYRLLVCKRFYEKHAVLNTVYKFSDKAYFTLDSYDETYVAVLFRFYDNFYPENLEEFANSFYSELNDQQIRMDIETRTSKIKEVIYNKAFSAIRSIK